MDWHWDDHEHQALDERVVQACAVSAPVVQVLVLVPAPAPLPRVRPFRAAANAPRFLFAIPHAPPVRRGGLHSLSLAQKSIRPIGRVDFCPSGACSH
jgi:hypothetical protein